MLFGAVSVVGGVAAGATLMAAAQIDDGKSEAVGRQFNGYPNQNQGSNSWGYGGNSNSNGYNSNNNGGYNSNSGGYTINRNSIQHDNGGGMQQGGSDYMLLQQYGSSPGYYDVYGNSATEYAHDPYFAAASYGTGTMASDNTHSSPALSALALLGFLYFLNLIQDVLQNNGRRKRSLTSTEELPETDSLAREGHYFTSYFGEEPGGDIERQDIAKADDKTKAKNNNEEPEPRSFSFLEDFFIRLPQSLGIKRMLKIDRGEPDERPMGIGNFIKSRLKMISSIMSFLQDPSPYRIRRDIQEDVADDVVEERAIGSLPSPSVEALLPLINEVLKDYDKPAVHPFAPGYLQSEGKGSSDTVGGMVDTDKSSTESEDGEVKQRDRRHTTSAMNAWYTNLNGHSIEQESQADRVAAKVASLLGNGNSEGLQEALKKNTVPALVELSQGLKGGHPHCLQRALCRLNAQSHQLSFMPRLALQILSSNLAGVPLSSKEPDDNLEAIKAGRRGEDCDQTFSGCQTPTILENT